MQTPLILHLLILILSINPPIARLHYNGGGDWYNDPYILPNLLHFINETTGSNYPEENRIVSITDNTLFDYPILFITGHGNIHFSEEEIKILRKYILNGGKLYIDDDYGMDKYIRKELQKLFPNKKLVPLPKNSTLFHIYYIFPNGLPQIHKHYNNTGPIAYAIFEGTKPIILYTFNSNISDGWNKPSVYNDPPEICHTALKMGTNIILYLIYGEEKNVNKNK